jgi:glycosyltransferase involved in cell wall biosynthesis
VERSLAACDAALEQLESLHEEGLVDALYERLSLWSVAGAVFARRRSIPFLVEVNAPLTEEASKYRSLPFRETAAYLEEKVLRDASRVVVVSEELAEYAAAHRVARDKITVLPNAINPSIFREDGLPGPRPEGPKRDGFWIGFVGSLKPWHGVEILVEAFLELRKERSDYRLLIVGDGPLIETVRSTLLRAVPADAFCLTGAVRHSEVPRFLRIADVAVAPYPELPSFYFSPMKVFEYCAMGKALVASRIGQVATLLKDGETALLTKPGDAGELAGAIRALREDAPLRARLGTAARSLVEGRTWTRNAEEVIRLFRELSVHGPASRIDEEAHSFRGAGPAVLPSAAAGGGA